MKKPISLLLFLLVLLWGCGGRGVSSGGGGGSLTSEWTFGLVSGSIAGTMPRGAGAPAVIRTPVSFAPIAADGAFQVGAYGDGPCPASVEDADGNVLMTVFISNANSTVDSALLARSFAYLALKGFLLPYQGRIEFWNELADQPEVQQLAIDLAALSGPIEQNAAQIKALVRADLEPLSLRMTATGSDGLLINPSNGQSGVEVLQQGLSEIYLKNHYRRRAWAYVTRIESTYPSGPPEPRNEAIANFSVDTITNPSSVNGAVADVGTILGDYFSGSNSLFTGNVAWVPTTTSPLNVPVFPNNAVATKYRVLVVGPGRGGSSPPEWASELMQQKRSELVTQTIMQDLVMPAFFAGIGPITNRYNQAGRISDREKEILDQVLLVTKDLISGIIAAPAIQQKFDDGDVAGAMADVWTAIYASDAYSTAIKGLMLEFLRLVIQRAAEELHQNIPAADLIESADRLWGAFEAAFRAVDWGLLGGDFAMVIGHWASSNAYETFTVDSTKARVVLTPPHGQVSVTQSLELNASVPDATGEEAPLITYHWTLSGMSGVQFNSGTQQGTDITSSSGTVQFVSLNNQTGTAEVQVEAILHGNGSETTSLGTATSTIDVVNDRAVLTPARSSIQPSTTQTLIARITNPRPNAHYQFKWHSSRRVGSLSTPEDILTSQEIVTYTSNGDLGSDDITIDAYENGPSGPVRIGSSSARVLVETEPTVIPATYSAFSAAADGRGRVVALVRAPRVQGATGYRLVGTGGYDYAYFGGSINFAISPFNNEPQWGLIEPPNEVWVGLSGWDGPESGISGAIAWMDSRFSGFSFYVEVTR